MLTWEKKKEKKKPESILVEQKMVLLYYISSRTATGCQKKKKPTQVSRGWKDKRTVCYARHKQVLRSKPLTPNSKLSFNIITGTCYPLYLESSK